MNFKRAKLNGLFGSMTAYSAKSGRWQFLILQDKGQWTVSYRIIDPSEPVSASSTIMGPFDSFDDAARAAEEQNNNLWRAA
jgi:hypothetical protein